MICLRGPGTNLSLLIGAAKGEGWGGGGEGRGTGEGGLPLFVILTFL